MNETFIKKYWREGNIIFYLHFQDGQAVRQVEITDKAKRFLSTDRPVQEDSKLYEESLDLLELDEKDLVSKEQFDEIWKQNNSDR